MKLNCLILSLGLSLGTFCFAQNSAADDSRSLPTGLNDAPPLPPGFTPGTPAAPLPAAGPAPTRLPVPTQRPLVGGVNPPPLVAQPMILPPPLPSNLLAWDSESKEYNVPPGEMQAPFTFYFTNVSSTNVVIANAVASCGCTVPKLQPLPWTNAPGASGQIPVMMNLAGKSGTVMKTITVNTDQGQKILYVKAIIPPPAAAPGSPDALSASAAPMDRNKNQELAKSDRQAVFKGDCASCHVQPARGKMGKDLYDKACGICHDSEHRATMVPDLHALKHDTNTDFWKTWTSQGKPGTLMPAFALSEGGPLNDAQINSLAQYLTATIPARAVPSHAATSVGAK